MSCDRNCKFIDTGRCDTCISYSNYEEKEIKKPKGLRYRNTNKADKRMGSSFEKNNHDKNAVELKEISTNMTVNSGATRREKGDENITGYMRVAEELKTQIDGRKGGNKSFSIKREWLKKLCIESQQKGMESWYLVFSFSENESIKGYDPEHPEGNVFVVMEKPMVFNMVKTICEDRYRADLAALNADMANKKVELLKSELSALRSSEQYLKAQIKVLEKKLEHNDNN